MAAGASSRMGRDKALLPWPAAESSGRGTLLSAAIVALKPFTENGDCCCERECGAACSGCLAMRGFDGDQSGTGAGIVPSSMQIGLRAALDRGCDAAMITPVDCPPLSAATLELLRDSFVSALARGMWAVAPENGGKRGHPLLTSRELIEAFLAAPATSNARDVKCTCEERFEYVAVL